MEIVAERASPIQMRKALDLVRTLKASRIDFVPVPVLNPEDKQNLLKEVIDRLDKLEKQQEKNK